MLTETFKRKWYDSYIHYFERRFLSDNYSKFRDSEGDIYCHYARTAHRLAAT